MVHPKFSNKYFFKTGPRTDSVNLWYINPYIMFPCSSTNAVDYNGQHFSLLQEKMAQVSPVISSATSLSLQAREFPSNTLVGSCFLFYSQCESTLLQLNVKETLFCQSNTAIHMLQFNANVSMSPLFSICQIISVISTQATTKKSSFKAICSAYIRVSGPQQSQHTQPAEMTFSPCSTLQVLILSKQLFYSPQR